MRKKSEGGATLNAGIVFPNLHQLRRSQGSPASLAWAVVVVLVDCESVFHVSFSAISKKIHTTGNKLWLD